MTFQYPLVYIKPYWTCLETEFRTCLPISKESMLYNYIYVKPCKHHATIYLSFRSQPQHQPHFSQQLTKDMLDDPAATHSLAYGYYMHHPSTDQSSFVSSSSSVFLDLIPQDDWRAHGGYGDDGGERRRARRPLHCDVVGRIRCRSTKGIAVGCSRVPTAFCLFWWIS